MESVKPIKPPSDAPLAVPPLEATPTDHLPILTGVNMPEPAIHSLDQNRLSFLHRALLKQFNALRFKGRMIVAVQVAADVPPDVAKAFFLAMGSTLDPKKSFSRTLYESLCRRTYTAPFIAAGEKWGHGTLYEDTDHTPTSVHVCRHDFGWAAFYAVPRRKERAWLLKVQSTAEKMRGHHPHYAHLGEMVPNRDRGEYGPVATSGTLNFHPNHEPDDIFKGRTTFSYVCLISIMGEPRTTVRDDPPPPLPSPRPLIEG